MDTSQNRDIGMRQNLLRVGGKNTLPPSHIIQQQRRLSQSQLSQDRKIFIHSKHKELCPLCFRPSFVFEQVNQYGHSNNNHHQHHSSQPGTFMCSKCSNKEIQFKLSVINKLKQENKKLIQKIQPILHQKANAKNSKYQDKKLKIDQYEKTINNLRVLILQKQRENKLLKANNAKLNESTKTRRKHLQQIQPKLSQKWRFAITEYQKKADQFLSKQSMNQQISTKVSIKQSLKIADFYKLKVLPIMHQNEQRKLSMIQNIAIPSTFKIKHIRDFYNNPQNELFRFPLPSNIANMPFSDLSIDNHHHHTQKGRHTQSHSSLKDYKSAQYSVPLKNGKVHKSKSAGHKNKSKSKAGSPLQKYIPRLTNSISSVSAQMGIPVPFLTPPGFKRQDQKQYTFHGSEIDKLNSKSLPKNLDDLVLPPTFFSSDDDDDQTEKKQSENDTNYSIKQNHDNPNKLSGRGRSQSLDTISMPIKSRSNKSLSKRLIHEPHIEHGICAALQYTVSFVLHVSKYLNVQLLYNMGLYRKNKRGQFIMHTYIERKGRYYRLYWICPKDTDKLNEEDEEDLDNDHRQEHKEEKENLDRNESLPLSIATASSKYHGNKIKLKPKSKSLRHSKSKSKSKLQSKSNKKRHHEDGGNILEFEHALHLLEENINDLCIKCGVKSNKLQYFQFIANLIELIKHLERKYKELESISNTNDIKRHKFMDTKANVNANTNNHRNATNNITSSSNINKSNLHRPFALQREKSLSRERKVKRVKTHKLEHVNIIPDYGLTLNSPNIENSNSTHLYREHSTSITSSHSFSESTTAINNSESDIVISPPGDSEHEDWDFVDYN